MRRTVRSITYVVLCLITGACANSPGPDASTGPQTGLPTGTLTITTDGPPAELSVEIAETEATREIGLMGRTQLAPDSGMVFLLGGPGHGPFTMENTLVPLSIAFWDDQGRIVYILDMQPCHEDPCPVYYPGPYPGAEYVGAVEANLGYFAANGVRVGDTVKLQR